jgi:Domain of unknown function (DUF4265)
MEIAGEPTAKVLFRVPNDDGTADVETLWAVPLGDDKYQLDNSPFYAYSVSWRDIVYAPIDSDEGRATFRHVEAKSGNRTVRVALEEPAERGNESQRLLDGLLSLGCTYEGANRRLISVNVPANVELSRVRDYLIEAEANWEHADPTYDELFPGKGKDDG